VLLIEDTGFLLCHVVLPKTNSDHTIDGTFTGWHSPIVKDTSVRRILDFQTVLG